MTRLIHLTDLHFGLHHAGMVAPLAAAIRGARGDLLVMSGDLTQRARPAQFADGMAFLRSLGLPWLAVPGNHDVPLYNLAARWLAPFRGWRRGVARDLAPVAQAGRARLWGLTSATPWHWRRGVLRPDQMAAALAAMRAGPADAVNVLVPHHPLEEPPGFQRGETRGSRAALAALAGVPAPVVLSGHLHQWFPGLGIAPGAPRPVLQIHTGTALCARPAERDHGFAVIDIGQAQVGVTPHLWDGAAFAPRPPLAFRWRDGLWHRA